MAVHVPILAYHAIVENDRLALPPEWSRQHAVALQAFRAQLDTLASEGWHSVMPEAVRAGTIASKSVVLTFDDGHASDIAAAAELRRCGLQAVFFVTCEYLGNPGYLDCGQVRQIASQGFRIGSHGINHVRLAELSPEQMALELTGSKARLEDMTGKPVTNLAVPFGSYNSKVIACAIAAGYRTILTSDFAVAKAGNYVLPRLEVHHRTRLKDFRMLLSGSPMVIGRRRLSNALYRRVFGLRASS